MRQSDLRPAVSTRHPPGSGPRRRAALAYSLLAYSLLAMTVIGLPTLYVVLEEPPPVEGCTEPFSDEDEVRETIRGLAVLHEQRREAGIPCPATLEELIPRRRSERPLLDPWGTPYRHACTPGPEPGLLVISVGPDGKFGTGDEISGGW